MSETRDGALIGAFVGCIQGIISAIYLAKIFPPMIAVMMRALTAQMAQQSPEVLRFFPGFLHFLMEVVIVASPIIGVIMGCALGVLFVALRKKIPGSSIIRKSVAFSLILVAISAIGEVLNLFNPTGQMLILTNSTFRVLMLTGFALVVIEYPILGFIFGYLLNRRLRAK